MAKVTGPLYSDTATGRLGTALSYRIGKVWQMVTPQFHRGPSVSAALENHRAAYAAGCLAWQNLSPEEKTVYDNPPDTTITPFNYFMRIYLTGFSDFLSFVIFGTAIFNAGPDYASFDSADYASSFPSGVDEFPTMVDGLNAWQAWLHNRAADSIQSTEQYILDNKTNIEG